MTKSTAVLGWIAALTCAGCVDGLETATDESELGGFLPTMADGEHDAVGIVRVGPFCTGTRIAESFVLTAAHCICVRASDCVTPPDVTTGTFTFKNVPVVGNDISGPGDVLYNVSAAYVHPDYDVGTRVENDIAVLEIAPAGPAAADVPPLALAVSVPHIGDPVTLVGYGQAAGYFGDGPMCQLAEGDKRAGNTEITQVVNGGAGDLTYFFDTYGGNAVHGCSGDSGGPALAGPDGPIVGVNTVADGGKVVASYRPWLLRQLVSPGNHVAAFDLSGGGPAGRSLYTDNMPDSQLGWLDPLDVQLTGDFMDTGTDQILYINRSGSTGGSQGLIKIASYADGLSPASFLYWQSWNSKFHFGFSPFIQTTDKFFVGDFRGLGYDQLLMLNQSGSGSQLKVIDFKAGVPMTRYSSTYINEPLVGWHDADDSIVIGDFRGLGHDQAMFINRAGSQGRIAIVDFSDAVAPGEWVYFEGYADGVELNGWTDPGDLAVAGDYRGLGYDQVLFVNRGAGNGRFLVADFHDGWFPAEWQYYEAYGWSTFLDGFHDTTADVVLAGDFRGLGFDQVVFVNRNLPSYGRAMVVDFHDGVSPSNPGFFQSSVLASPLLTRIDPTDVILAGGITSSGHDELVTIEP